jgi:hypothetical protein
MNWIKKNLLWLVIGFVVYKQWDKIGPMIGFKPKETPGDSAKAIEEGFESDLA